MSAAWRLVTGLPAYEVTEIPRLAPPGAGEGRGEGAPDPVRERLRRSRALAASCLAGYPAGFGWVRVAAGGAIRVITAGRGMRSGRAGAEREGGGHLLSFPPGAVGRPLGPGGLAGAFGQLRCWEPVAILPDELLRDQPSGDRGPGTGPGLGVPLEESLLGSWEDPFGFLVIAEPVGEERRQEMLLTVSLAQLTASRHDTPRAQVAVRRAGTRHEELRASSARGLWRTWFLAGGDSPEAASEVSAVLRTALDLSDLPFGLVPGEGAGTLPGLLGAPPGIGDGREQGPLAREVTAMYAGDPRGARPYTAPAAPGPAPAEAVQDSPGWAPSAPDDAAERARAAGEAGNEAAARGRREAGEADRARREAEDRHRREAAAAAQRARQANSGIPGMPWTAGNAQAGPGGPSGYPGQAPSGQPAGFPGQWSGPPPPPVFQSFAPGAAAGAGTGPRPAWLGGAQADAPRDGQGNGGSAPASAPAARAADFPDPEPEWPCAVSSDLLAALAVPPSEEIPGVEMVLRPRFDVTPGRALSGAGAGPAVGLGVILDRHRRPSGALDVRTSSLNRHAFICGATGSGKSQTTRHLLESAAAEGIPWLVIEPAKAEYRLMASRLPDADVVVIRPGDLAAVPAGLNPLEPAAGPDGSRFPLQAHSDLVRSLFLAAFQAEEPFPQVLARALTKVYTEAGWDLLTGQRTDGSSPEGAAYPGLGELQRAALQVVEEIGYSREITDNVRGFVSVRIGSLLGGTTGGFLHGAFPLDYGKLLTSNVVLEIEDCGDDTDRAFIAGAVLIRLAGHLRMRARAEGAGVPGLRHLTVIEEAHRLLRQPPEGAGAGAAAKAVEMFADLLAEIRAYGEGIVIAEQIPSKLIADAIKNTAVKIVHRLPAQDDRSAVGASMNLTEDQSRFLVTLEPGTAAFFADGMDYPMLARMPDGTGREAAGQGRAPVTARGLVGTRSRACPQSCTAQPCVLGQIAAGRQARARDRRITLWAELAVVAHLTGWRTPVPSRLFAAALKQLDARVLECALAHASEEAVSARSAVLVPRVDPAGLAAHVSGALRNILAGRGACRPEQEWLAPAAEWEMAADELRAAIDAGQEGRHPLSGEWERILGRRIPGDDCAAQLAAAEARHQATWGQESRRLPVIFGTAAPSAVEDAYGGRRDAPDWRWQVEQVTGAALDPGVMTWVPDYLAPWPGAAPGQAGTPGGTAGPGASAGPAAGTAVR
jgi:hypothetical protein